MWRNNGGRCFKTVMSLTVAVLVAACEATIVPNLPGLSSRPEAGGIVVADEPQAVLLTREILNAGGSAADAAVALGFGLSVTLQSRAGLGGGGACLVYDVNRGQAEVMDFSPTAATGNEDSARWQVGVPTLARGLFALHAKYGRLPWQQVVVPAENIVRFENVVSRALARDLLVASGSLVNDPKALDTFMAGRRMAEEGDRVQQLDLAATIGRIRGRTPGDFYSGAFARTIERNSALTGASLSATDLRAYAPRWREASSTRLGSVVVYSSATSEAENNALRYLSEPGEIPQEVTDATESATGFVVADADGNVVACSLTMLAPFGNGLMPAGLGFLLSPSPDSVSSSASAMPSLIAVNAGARDVLFAAASGGEGSVKRIASISAEVLVDDENLSDVLSARDERADESGALINAFHCRRGLAQDIRACDVKSDPKGFGFGLVAFGEM